MSKKKRKSRSSQPNLPQETIDRAEARASHRPVEKKPAPPPAEEGEKPATPQAQPAGAKPAVNLAQEYRYVVQDLQRIGLLAAAMLVVLALLKLLAG